MTTPMSSRLAQRIRELPPYLCAPAERLAEVVRRMAKLAL